MKLNNMICSSGLALSERWGDVAGNPYGIDRRD